MTTNPSKEQQKQEQDNNKHTQNAAQAGGIVDKKLDGPNRPST